MDNIDFITVSLNLRPSQIKLLNSALNDGILHIYISLNPEESECPFCGGKIKIHSYSQELNNSFFNILEARILISFKQISCIDFVLHIIKTRIIAISHYGL